MVSSDLDPVILKRKSARRFDKKGRENCLRKLKREGLAVRQLERLTGINRGIIQKA